jgi:tetratricopeptide (TPR) repeat protein
MKNTLIGLLLCLSLILSAQNSAIQNAVKNYDYETAVKLLSKEKKSVENDFLKAKCYKNLSRYNEAIVLLEDMVKQEGTGLSAINELADCYQLMGNLKKAKFFYSMALQTAPDNRFEQLSYLNIIFKLREWKPTIQAANAILQKDSLPTVYPVLGDCFSQLSKMDSAVCFYKKAMTSNPEDYNTLSKLAKIYFQAEKYAELLSSTNRYLVSDSSNQVINQFNGIGYCMTGNYDKAIYRLNKLFQQGDSSYLTNYYLGASYFATKDNTMAYEHLLNAYLKDSTNQHLFLYLGKSAILSGHQKKGIDILNKGLTQLIPKDSVLFDYYYNLSVGYNRMWNNHVDEIKYLKLAYKFKPEYKFALYTIAELYDFELKKPEEAMEYYAQFVAARPKAKKETNDKTASISYYNVAENRLNEIKLSLDKKAKK